MITFVVTVPLFTPQTSIRNEAERGQVVSINNSNMPASLSARQSTDWKRRIERATLNPDAEAKNGVLASDFLAELLDKKSIGRVYRTPKTREQALFNWMLVLKETKAYVDGIYKAEELLKDDGRRAEFLKKLASIGLSTTQQGGVKSKAMEFESPPGSPRQALTTPVNSAALHRSATAQHFRRSSNQSELIQRTSDSRPSTPLKTTYTGNSPLIQTSPAPSPFIKPSSKPAIGGRTFLVGEQSSVASQSVPHKATHLSNGESALQQRTGEMPRAAPAQTAYEKPVPESVQEGLIGWVESLDMVKKGALTPHLLVSFSRTGVFLCDLINRLEGRKEALKGVQRNPKNNTAAYANVTKALEFLKGFPKVNSRYLWSGQKVIEGNENVIWGLLEDIKTLYSGKTKDQGKSPIKAPKPPLLPPKPSSAYTQPSAATKIQELSLPHSFLQAKSSVLRSYANSARSRSPMARAPSVRTPRKAEEHVEVPEVCVTDDVIEMVEEWLSALGLEYLLGFEVSSVTEDPLKNGTLLCELVSLLERTHIRHQAAPRSEKAVRENIEKALDILREKRPGVPYGLLLAGKRLAQGDTKLMWALLWGLMSAYPNAGVSHTSELPYGAVATKRLEASLLHWLHSTNVLNRLPTSLHEVIPQIKNGTLVIALVNKLVPRACLEVVDNPRTEVGCQQTLHKALEVLQRVAKMSQKWTWKEKDLLRGDTAATLGLLEDLHRFADGLPARKRGAAYHSDGPYLGGGVPDNSTEVQFVPNTPSWKGNAMESPLSFKAESPSAHFRVNRVDSISSFTPSQVPPRVFERGMSEAVEAHELSQWVISLGVTQAPLNLQGDVLEGFGDGLLLCKILEAVSRTPISGLSLYPRTKAACLLNARKGLQMLQQIPRFPRELLFTEQEIIAGDGPSIRALLKEIQSRYKAPIAKSNGRN